MEKGSFEDSVKKAFENAEVNPTENSWANIELHLEKEKGLVLKEAFENAGVSPGENTWVNIALQLERSKGILLQRKLFRYKMLAAASVVFVLGVSFGMVYYQQVQSEKYRLALEQIKRDNQT